MGSMSKEIEIQVLSRNPVEIQKQEVFKVFNSEIGQVFFTNICKPMALSHLYRLRGVYGKNVVMESDK